jgi:hypothetical protein
MRGDGGCGVSSNKYICAHHVTRSPNKLRRSISIFNLCLYYGHGIFPLLSCRPSFNRRRRRPRISMHRSMDEGTIKTPFPKCRLYWCFCLGWCSNLEVLNLVRNRVLNSCRIWSTTQLNTPTPLPATHCLFVLFVYFGKGGEGWGSSERR